MYKLQQYRGAFWVDLCKPATYKFCMNRYKKMFSRGFGVDDLQIIMVCPTPSKRELQGESEDA